MKRIILYALVAALAVTVLSGLAMADQAADAKTLVEKAVAMATQKGLDVALKAINDLKGPFVKGNLYVFAMSLENTRLAAGSPFNKQLLGTVANAPFNRKMAEIAKGPGSGWLTYAWPKPDKEKPSPKKTYIMRVPGHDAYFGCGYYTE